MTTFPGPRPYETVPRERGVYFAWIPQSFEVVKIGWAKNVARRIAELQCGSPHKMYVLAIVKGAGPDRERELHRRFAKLKTHDGGAEWYRLDRELLGYISALRLING